MIPELIQTFKERLDAQAFIEQNYALGLSYTVNAQKTPVVFEGDEPLQVNFDNYRSVSFWLLNGPVNQTQRDSDVSCGAWVQKKVPLRLIYYSGSNGKKICVPVNEDALGNIISVLAFQDDKELRSNYWLSSISLQATSQEFRREVVWNYLYGNLPFKMREHEQLFSVDFDLVFEGDPLCWTIPCAPVILQETDPLQALLTEGKQNLFE